MPNQFPIRDALPVRRFKRRFKRRFEWRFEWRFERRRVLRYGLRLSPRRIWAFASVRTHVGLSSSWVTVLGHTGYGATGSARNLGPGRQLCFDLATGWCIASGHAWCLASIPNQPIRRQALLDLRT